jgi:MoaA/NifB/PqqE/SkfB family radical SAM enzyme
MHKTVSFSKHACNVFFHILTRCNLACTHCYINPEQHGDQTLPLETITTWLHAFVDKSQQANVIFLGGEPTLHPALPQAIKAARSMGFSSVTVDTNGYLFHRVLERIEPSEVDFFSFSLDGASRATNDRLRGRGSYDACIAGIEKAVAAGFDASLIYTVSANNLHELQTMPAMLAAMGISRFFIQVIGLRGKSAQGPQTGVQVAAADWLRIIPEVADDAADRGITATFPKVFLKPEERFECAGLVADNYFIFPNGRVYRCPLCEDHPLHSLKFEAGELKPTDPINETDLFQLNIPEGCVMNRLIQPENLSYRSDGTPQYKIACCLLKEERRP